MTSPASEFVPDVWTRRHKTAEWRRQDIAAAARHLLHPLAGGASYAHIQPPRARVGVNLGATHTDPFAAPRG